MRYLLGLALSCVFISSAGATDWTEFRGPTGQGHAGTPGAPLEWSETKNIAWKQPVAGRGWSSPVVQDGKIWLTTAIEEPLTPEVMKARLEGVKMAGQLSVPARVSLRALAFDLKSGEVLHDVELFNIDDPEPIHALNSYASPTPVIEPGRVYCHFGTYGTACVDTSTAKILWSRRLKLEHAVGPGSSPFLYKDRLILVCDGVDAQFITALDAATGATRWLTNRPEMKGDDGDLHKAYCTPLLIEYQGREQLIVPGAQWVVAYDPQSGRPLWQVSYGGGFSNVPRPVYGEGIVYICSGFMVPELLAIRVDGSGDVTASHVVWRDNKQIPAMPSPLLLGQELYVISDKGVATCFDALTGKVNWRERVPGNHSASPVLADGRIFFFNREGLATAIEPGKEFRTLVTNQLDGQFMASPAFVDGAMLLRTDTHLYKIAQ